MTQLKFSLLDIKNTEKFLIKNKDLEAKPALQTSAATKPESKQNETVKKFADNFSSARSETQESNFAKSNKNTAKESMQNKQKSAENKNIADSKAVKGKVSKVEKPAQEKSEKNTKVENTAANKTNKKTSDSEVKSQKSKNLIQTDKSNLQKDDAEKTFEIEAGKEVENLTDFISKEVESTLDNLQGLSEKLAQLIEEAEAGEDVSLQDIEEILQNSKELLSLLDDISGDFGDAEKLEKFRASIADMDISQELKDLILSLDDKTTLALMDNLKQIYQSDSVNILITQISKVQEVLQNLSLTNLEKAGIVTKNLSVKVLKELKNLKASIDTKLANYLQLVAEKFAEQMAFKANTATNAKADLPTENLIKDILLKQNNSVPADAKLASGVLADSVKEAGLNFLRELAEDNKQSDKLNLNNKFELKKYMQKQELATQMQKNAEAKNLENLAQLTNMARRGIDFLSTNSMANANSGARATTIPSMSMYNQAGMFNAETMMARIHMMQARNMKTADIRLDPPELGSVKVRIKVHNEQTSVQFQSANPHVREIIEQSLPRLKEMLQDSGINLADADVSEDNSFAQQSSASNFGENSENKGEKGLGVYGDDSNTGEENIMQKEVEINTDSLINYYA